MKVLFVGGTGVISSACARLAVARGMEVTFLCRGQSGRHPVPASVTVLRADVRDERSARNALGVRRFDAVVEWIGYVPAHVRLDIDLFRERTRQYVFISSASAYQTPPSSVPITESTPLSNPVWQYSRNKIDCEELLVRAYREDGFPITIVRPSHTYDMALLPVHGGWTVVDRMRRGLPIVVHGDGTSLWTLTHNEDFAVGLVGLLGRATAIGEAYHITSDEVLTWNQIHQVIARAAGAEPKVVHVPSALIASFDREWGDSLLGDKSHSMIFDNTKIRRAVPDFRAATSYTQAAEKQVAWYDADARRRVVDERFDAVMQRIVEAQLRAIGHGPIIPG
jgi:nucleoside-diphosphate-sugar epimerase